MPRRTVAHRCPDPRVGLLVTFPRCPPSGLQRFCRRKLREYNAKVHRAQVKAAKVIQKCWNAFRKRKWFYGICLYGRMRRKHAASLIQRQFRMYKIRRYDGYHRHHAHTTSRRTCR